MRARTTSIFFFTFSCLLPAAAPAGKPQLLVMDLVVEGGISANSARLLNELMLTELERSGLFEVVGGTDLQAIVSNEEQKLLAGCTDVACLAEVAGALDTDSLAIASVGQVGASYLVNIKIVDVRRARVVARSTEQTEAGESGLPDAFRNVVQTIVDEARRELQGTPSDVDGEDDAVPLGGAAREIASHPDPGSPSLLLWSGLGLAVAATAAGGLLLGTNRSREDIEGSEYDDYVEGRTSYSAVQAAVDGHNNRIYAGSTLIVVGAVGTAVAIAALLWPSDDATTEATVVPTAGGAVVSLGGTF